MKKIISMMLVLVIICTFVGCGKSTATEPAQPGVVGSEYFDDVMRLGRLYEDNEFEVDYEVRMIQIPGYWVVCLESLDDSDRANLGIYDHYPSEEEIDNLWDKRMSEDELYEILDSYE